MGPKSCPFICQIHKYTKPPLKTKWMSTKFAKRHFNTHDCKPSEELAAEPIYKPVNKKRKVDSD